MEGKRILTTSNGCPVDDNHHSMTAGPGGPILLQDFHLIDKLAHFDREVIPERVVHAKGAGAHGYFIVSSEMSKYTRAKFLGEEGKKTPVFVRFSTVGGERGSADTERDPRGFAIKFYTEEGNYDMVGNNTPVFFIRDPLKFPEFIHTQKRCPRTFLKDPNRAWDFWVRHHECLHQVTILFSDRGTPDGYRFMNGYSSHTFKWVNAAGEAFWVKYHFKTDQGIKNLSADKAHQLKADNPDYATQDLSDAIERGDFPSWTLKMQIMPEADAANYEWDVTDVTKVWPHTHYPLQEVGKLVLNKNPTDYHCETEQSAFSPSHLVPGIEPSNDKMLQGRLFSYPDTHRHRLGANYNQLAINCPYRTRVHNYMKDGPMARYNENNGDAYEGETNSYPIEDKASAWKGAEVTGKAGRYEYVHKNDDYTQPAHLYNKVFDEGQRARVTENIGQSLKGCNKELQEMAVAMFTKCDPDFGARISKVLGF